MVRERLLPTADAANDLAVPFIDLTICADYSFAYKDASLKNYGLDEYMYRYEGVYANLTSHTVDDLRLIYTSITHDVDEIISTITFFTADGNVKGVEINFNNTNYHDHIMIRTLHSFRLGRCYSIRPKAHLLEKTIQMIDIVSHIDAYIYFGHPGQAMHPDSTSRVISFNRTFSIRVKLVNHLPVVSISS